MISAVYETILYAEDVSKAASFYERTLGLPLLREVPDRSAVFRMSPECHVLLFNPSWSERGDRGIASHGARGSGHIALRIREQDLAAWRDRLAKAGIRIELERRWPAGGHSLYIRDPAGNSVELAAGEVWLD